MTHYFDLSFDRDNSYAFHYTDITCSISEMNNYFGNDKDENNKFFFPIILFLYIQSKFCSDLIR